MSIEVVCQGCSRKLAVNDAFAGKEGRCPFCRMVLHIPAPGEWPIALGPKPQLGAFPEREPAAPRKAEPKPAPKPQPTARPLPVGKIALIGGIVVAVVLIVVAVVVLTPQWLEALRGSDPNISGMKPEKAKPVEATKQPPEEAGKQPPEPVEQPNLPVPLSVEVAERMPPGAVAYIELPQPGKFIAAFGKQRLWSDATRAQWVVETGLSELLDGVAAELSVPSSVLLNAADRVDSLHVCVVDLFPRLRWALLARYRVPQTFNGLLGDTAETLAGKTDVTYYGVEAYILTLPRSKSQVFAACCGNYLALASDELALKQIILLLQKPGEAGQSMAGLPAFRKALEARAKAPDDLWAFVDAARLVQQAAASGQPGWPARLIAIDQALDLSSFAGVAGAVSFSQSPGMSIDVVLNAPHPLFAALQGKPVSAEMSRIIPAEATFVARVNLSDAEKAWETGQPALSKIASAFGVDAPAKLKDDLEAKLGKEIWQGIAAVLGEQVALFSTQETIEVSNLGIAARIKNANDLKALIDHMAQAPAFAQMKFVEEAIGEVKLAHPEQGDVFPCYAYVDGYAVLTSRTAPAKLAIAAYQNKKPLGGEELDAALKAVGEGPSKLAMVQVAALGRTMGLEAQVQSLLHGAGWTAAGLTIQPDRLKITLSDPIPSWAAVNWLAGVAEKAEQRRRADCLKNLREISLLLTKACPLDPQFLYPANVQELVERGFAKGDDDGAKPKAKDLSIFRCPSDRHPTHYGEGLDVSYQFIFEELDFRVSIELPLTCMVAWDKKDTHPGMRGVVFVDNHVETVTEKRFQELLAETRQQAEKFKAKTVNLPK